MKHPKEKLEIIRQIYLCCKNKEEQPDELVEEAIRLGVTNKDVEDYAAEMKKKRSVTEEKKVITSEGKKRPTSYTLSEEAINKAKEAGEKEGRSASYIVNELILTHL